VMGHGRVVFEGTPAELTANEAIRKEWLESLGAGELKGRPRGFAPGTHQGPGGPWNP
jgi:hypothetical protein